MAPVHRHIATTAAACFEYNAPFKVFAKTVWQQMQILSKYSKWNTSHPSSLTLSLISTQSLNSTATRKQIITFVTESRSFSQTFWLQTSHRRLCGIWHISRSGSLFRGFFFFPLTRAVSFSLTKTGTMPTIRSSLIRLNAEWVTGDGESVWRPLWAEKKKKVSLDSLAVFS